MSDEPATPPDSEPDDGGAREDTGAPAAPAKRRLFRRRSTSQAAPEATSGDGEPESAAVPEDTPAEAPPDAPAQPAKPPGRGSLKRERRKLADARQEVQFHLGGLAMELHRRGALTEPVLRRRADQLLDLDEQVQLLEWRLEAIESERRQRKGSEPPVAGSCLSCGADFAPEAVFCWRCGTRFAPETEAQSAQTTEIGTLPT